jgi:carbonic anhydrase
MRVSFALKISLVAASLALVGAAHAESSHGKAPHWCYDKPACEAAHWGDLEAGFAHCKNGKAQSPINLEKAQTGPLAPMAFKYQDASLSIVNNGHTIQVNLPKGSSARIGGQEYELLQFHFHGPSEHRVDGQSFPLEVHFVHKNKAGELAVVGVFLTEGKANPALQKMWGHLPKDVNKEQKVEAVKINPATLLPAGKTHYHYNGSLTTPPCSEKVNWNVMADPVEISKEQIAQFQALYKNNARPVQPMHGRALVRG